MSQSKRYLVCIAAIVSLLVPVLAASAETVPPANEHFQRTWERTDHPVGQGEVDRTWMWGPGANTGSMWEDYLESPDGTREVQYFDKSRMEINQTGEPEDSFWYVTNGLLVVELITGQMQVGEDSFEEREPSTLNVAGDRDGESGPSYAVLNDLRPATDDRGRDAITEIVDQAGNVTEDPGLADQGIHTAHYDNVTGHNVAEPFWDFMTSSGLVYENGSYVHAAMFQHPVYATGRPIIEPYWAHVPVAGEPQWVLLQAFERRVLTYTPGNPDGWKVEAGNVGRHYFEWRYGHPVDHDPSEDGSDDTGGSNGGNGGTSGNGGDGGNGGDDGGDDGDGDDGNGGDDPGDTPGDGDDPVEPDLGLNLSGQVNAAGSQIDFDATVTNNNEWAGEVLLQLECPDGFEAEETIQLEPNGNATVQFANSDPDGSVVDVYVCTVTALVDGDEIASGTHTVVDILPDTEVLPDLDMSLDADASILEDGLLGCDAVVDISLDVTNNNDYEGPVTVEVTGTTGLTTFSETQTVNLDGPGTIPIELEDDTIDLAGLIELGAQTYTAQASVDGENVGSATGSTASLGIPALCLS